ncbi:hypothetical protein ACFQ7J_07520 [Streptomyces sp. NPDC056501]|uniref:hypothetical protein n=1 Tax=Streptomyces sp. NPDC056501 TaxID=3345841 RepID=UPI00368B45A8
MRLLVRKRCACSTESRSGDFIIDRAHLRHLAMAAADLLVALDVFDEERER